MDSVVIATPIGFLEICGNKEGITSVTFSDANLSKTQTVPKVLKEAVNQLSDYFEGKCTDFNLKLNPQGTDFQKRVWKELQNIPYGKTCSYQQIASQLGNPKVIRAAASANGKNPISIIIPCHRVIGSDGSLTGYAGGLHRKKWLLELETPSNQQSLFYNKSVI